MGFQIKISMIYFLQEALKTSNMDFKQVTDSVFVQLVYIGVFCFIISRID